MQVIMKQEVMESYSSYELSKLLKLKGFDCLCATHYSYGNGDEKKGTPPQNLIYKGGFLDEHGCNRSYRNSELAKWELPYGEFTRPTHALAIEWLRINFFLFVYTTPVWNNIGYSYNYHILNLSNNDTVFLSAFKTPQEAMEVGLTFALRNLIE